MSPDNEVIEQSLSEPATFTALYDRHARSVYRYAAQRLGDHPAEDVMSETFLVAFEKRATYDTGVLDARPWLLGIATRLMRKHARTEAVAWKGMSADLAGQIAPDFIDHAGARIDAERLVRRLAKCSADCHALTATRSCYTRGATSTTPRSPPRRMCRSARCVHDSTVPGDCCDAPWALRPSNRRRNMDELTPLRSTRDDSRHPSEQALEAGRAALLDRANSTMAASDAAAPVRETETPTQPSAVRKRFAAPRWVAPAVAVALTGIVVGVLVPALVLGGTNTTPAVTSVPTPTPSVETTPEVTLEIYEAAYAKFAQCMKDKGSGLGAEYMEGVVHTYSYLAYEEHLYTECYDDFQQIDMAWQVAHSYDSPTYVALRNCLTQVGVQPADDADGVWQQVQEHNIDPNECTLGMTTPHEE